jgi:hypothetical protein
VNAFWRRQKRTFPHKQELALHGEARQLSAVLDPRREPCTLKRDAPMPTCKSCGDEADELLTVKVAGKTKKLCESCADEVREQGEVAEASEAVVQNMMGFKGRR